MYYCLELCFLPKAEGEGGGVCCYEHSSLAVNSLDRTLIDRWLGGGGVVFSFWCVFGKN